MIIYHDRVTNQHRLVSIKTVESVGSLSAIFYGVSFSCIQNGSKHREGDPESRPVMEGSTSTIDNEFEGSYRPNIVPLETDLDDDIQHGQSALYDGRYFSPAYNNSLNRMNKASPVSFSKLIQN